MSDQRRGKTMIIEMRTYLLKPGTVPAFMERFGKVIPARVKLSPLAGAWYSAIGSLNQFIHVWAYRDAGERERIRAEAQKTVEGWPPPTREFMLKQENMLVVPAACSPLH